MTNDWIAYAALIASGFYFSYREWIAPRLRARRLRNPVDAYCVIPRAGHHVLGYAEQDWQDHFVKDVTLPSQTSCQLQFCLLPRLSYQESKVLFGFLGDPSKKPIVQEFRNLYVKKGAGGSGRPGAPESTHLDTRLLLRRSSSGRLKSVPFDLGYLVQTREAGHYSAELRISRRIARVSLRVRRMGRGRPGTTNEMRDAQSPLVRGHA